MDVMQRTSVLVLLPGNLSHWQMVLGLQGLCDVKSQTGAAGMPICCDKRANDVQGQQPQQVSGGQQWQGSNSNSLLGNDFSNFTSASSSQSKDKQGSATPSSWATF